MSNVEPNTASAMWCGAKAGAFVGALLYLGRFFIPVTIGAFHSALLAEWMPLVVPAMLCSAGIVAIGGGIAGAFGAKSRQPVIGALIGALIIFVLMAICHVALFFSAREVGIELVLYAFVFGSLSGGIGTVVGRTRHTEKMRAKRLPISLPELLFFALVLAVFLGWEVRQFRRSQANAAIARAGATVTWNATEDPQGVWEIDLSGSNLDDSGLENLVPSLKRYCRLDLDLRSTGVTDSGLAQLKDVKNLVRVRLGKTQATDEGVSELKRARPDLIIDK